MKLLNSLPLKALAITALLTSFSALNPTQTISQPENSSPPASSPSSPTFTDIDNNIYKSEILKAAQLGIVSGFPNGTFRPQEPVTREQAISMIIDALNTLVAIDVNAKPTRRVRPFTDVDSSRWSAAKINWAQWNFSALQAGTPTGKFRPTDSVTRADLLRFLRSGAERAKANMGRSSALKPTQEATKFSDVSGNNLQLTLQMSAFCGVASPLNEKGTKFAPNQPARRDYTAAAIMRTLQCIQKDPQ